jgi:hypothetical protein
MVEGAISSGASEGHADPHRSVEYGQLSAFSCPRRVPAELAVKRNRKSFSNGPKVPSSAK